MFENKIFNLPQLARLARVVSARGMLYSAWKKEMEYLGYLWGRVTADQRADFVHKFETWFYLDYQKQQLVFDCRFCRFELLALRRRWVTHQRIRDKRTNVARLAELPGQLVGLCEEHVLRIETNLVDWAHARVRY